MIVCNNVKSRHFSEPRDHGEDRRGGYFIESDFDFRSPPSTRDNSRERRSRYSDYDPVPRDYYASDVTSGSGPRRGQQSRQQQQQQSENRKYQYGYQDLKNQIQSPTSPSSSSGIRINVNSSGVLSPRHDPLSPRRVEFADEVFNFSKVSTPGTSRPGSRCESPTPRSILRHTTSDPSHKSGRSNTVELGSVDTNKMDNKTKEAMRSNTTDLSFCQSDKNTCHDAQSRATEKNTPLSRPTSLIIPNNDTMTETSKHSSQPLVKILLPDDDSDDTLIEEKHETEELKEKRSDDVKKREVPPPLADWNRSQSFPPPGSSKNSENLQSSNLRKSSDPLGLSTSSLLSSGTSPEFQTDLDLMHGDTESLRNRVGDLEKQVHDNNDEIKCLRATLAECLRKIGDIETKIKQEPRTRRRELSEGGKTNRKAHVSSNIFGSQDFSNRATFEIHVPPQRGSYAPRQR